MTKTPAIALFVSGLLMGMAVMQAIAPLRAQEQSPLVTGIGGIFFKAQDPDALSAWYAENLGVATAGEGVNFFWREAEQPDNYGMTVWSIFEGGTDYFGEGAQQYMINYRVSDLDALLARLEAAGVAQVKPLEEYDYGRFAWVLDSEGNRIELWEPAAMPEAIYNMLRNPG